jgi:hypothetical protein
MKVVNLNTQEYSNQFPKSINYNGKIILNPTIEILNAIGWRFCKEIEIEEGFKSVNIHWIQDPEDPKSAIAEFDIVNIQEEQEQKETAWQNNKSTGLKTIENTYIDFLTNDWTPILRTAELIPVDDTITVSNTDETTNIGLLLQLRTINKSEYERCSNEFLKFKTMIKELGGVMSKVQSHNMD